MKKYSEIKTEIEGLSRHDQYNALLLTNEWSTFRDKILELDERTCQMCGSKEGPTYQKIPDHEYQRKKEQVLQHNKDFLAKLDNPQFQEKILVTEVSVPLEGLLPIPSDLIFTGQIILQVHHKYYFFKNLPWEYTRKDVETLCANCHAKVHVDNKIYVYHDRTMKQKIELELCKKCAGTGYIPEYDYFCYGVCFDCGGQGMLQPEFVSWSKS